MVEGWKTSDADSKLAARSAAVKRQPFAGPVKIKSVSPTIRHRAQSEELTKACGTEGLAGLRLVGEYPEGSGDCKGACPADVDLPPLAFTVTEELALTVPGVLSARSKKLSTVCLCRT